MACLLIYKGLPGLYSYLALAASNGLGRQVLNLVTESSAHVVLRGLVFEMDFGNHFTF